MIDDPVGKAHSGLVLLILDYCNADYFLSGFW